jgi:hypothetical protein
MDLYLGGATLLTDPQILTSGYVTAHSIFFFFCSMSCFRELGYIFAEGNLPETFKSFETDHMCNRFCRTFGLPTDYAKWDVVVS